MWGGGGRWRRLPICPRRLQEMRLITVGFIFFKAHKRRRRPEETICIDTRQIKMRRGAKEKNDSPKSHYQEPWRLRSGIRGGREINKRGEEGRLPSDLHQGTYLTHSAKWDLKWSSPLCTNTHTHARTQVHTDPTQPS